MFNIKATIAATAFAVFGTAATANNIVEIAAGDDRFSTLVAAVTAAGPGPVHGLRPCQRRVCSAACGHCRNPVEAGKQGSTDQRAALPR